MPAAEERSKPITLDELKALADEGGVETVAVAITDKQGRLTGKALSARYFLDEVVPHAGEACSLWWVPAGWVRPGWLYRAAADLRRTVRDGVWFVELAGLDDPHLVANVVISALGLVDQSGQWPTSVLMSHLSSREAVLGGDLGHGVGPGAHQGPLQHLAGQPIGGACRTGSSATRHGERG